MSKHKFLLIISSWGSRTDGTLYDEVFHEESGEVLCTVKVIPPKCIPLCQPCDDYFYRQVKNIINRLQNAPVLIKEKREIASREEAIKIHSLILHQWSAPVFIPMIQHAWYAFKLIEKTETFLNMNEVCFSLINLKTPCKCNEMSFTQCAWCRLNLCFKCFYDDYHPQFCTVGHNEEK